jgi:hypothetical protein
MAVKKNVQKAVDSAAPLRSRPDLNHQSLEVCLTKLTEYQKRLVTLNAAILETCDEGDALEAEIGESADYDDWLIGEIGSVKAALQSNVASQSFAVGKCVKETLVKLPDLEIGKFDSDPMNWDGFWDIFSSAVHDNPDLSDIERFTYLRQYLVGEAFDIADGYRLTAGNYASVIDALKERFGNPQLAIFAHISALLALPDATNEQTALQKTYNDCEKHVRSLVNLGLDEATFGQVFTPVILSKFPVEMRLDLNRRNGAQPWSLENLRKLLKDELRVRDVSCRQVLHQSTTDRFGQSETKCEQKSPQRTGPVAAASAAKMKCLFCQGFHASEKCDVHTDIKSRRRQLDGRCFCCLSEGHLAVRCRSRKACKHCGRKSHNSALCFKLMKSKELPPVAITAFGEDPKEILQRTHMQIANVGVHGENGKSVRSGALFDTAGYRSFITKKMAKQIGVKVVGEETVMLGAFGSSDREEKKYELARLHVETPQGTNTIHVGVCENIVPPIQRNSIRPGKNPGLQGLKFADDKVFSGEPMEVDFLVGADYYYQFVKPEFTVFNNGPVVVNSCFGHMLSGQSGV